MRNSPRRLLEPRHDLGEIGSGGLDLSVVVVIAAHGLLLPIGTTHSCAGSAAYAFSVCYIDRCYRSLSKRNGTSGAPVEYFAQQVIQE